MKSWFEIKVQADDPTVADINVFDFIGDWVDELWGFDGVTTAKSFIGEIEKLPEAVRTIRVHINSPGGDVFGGVTIANVLRDQRMSKGRKVETIVDGLAASAASIIAMAGDPVRMSDNGLLMIHNPWTVAVGEVDDMTKAAERLSTIRDALVSTYQWHSELSDEKIEALMDAETWMDASEAVANGFADEVVEGLSAVASIDPRGLAHVRVPEKYAERVAAFVRQPVIVDDILDVDPSGSPLVPDDRLVPGNHGQRPANAQDSEPIDDPLKPAIPAPTPVPEPVPPVATADQVLDVCKGADLDVNFVTELLASDPRVEDLEQLVGAERKRRDAEARRDADVRALFEKHNLNVLGGYLASAGVSVEAAKPIVTEITAALDGVEIDAGIDPDAGAQRKPAINYAETYARLNKLAK